MTNVRGNNGYKFIIFDGTIMVEIGRNPLGTTFEMDQCKGGNSLGSHNRLV